MKNLIFIGLLFFSFYGCSENSTLDFSNISSFQTGTYSGSYNIFQKEFSQEGLITISFSKDAYNHKIIISTNNTDTLESHGNYEIKNDTLHFNKNLEDATIVLPVWNLLGKFSVIANENNLTLHHKDKFTDYKIYLTRIK